MRDPVDAHLADGRADRDSDSASRAVCPEPRGRPEMQLARATPPPNDIASLLVGRLCPGQKDRFCVRAFSGLARREP